MKQVNKKINLKKVVNMNNYKLIQGDCIEEMQKLIDKGVKVDMVLTDPPYGTTACKWEDVGMFK